MIRAGLLYAGFIMIAGLPAAAQPLSFYLHINDAVTGKTLIPSGIYVGDTFYGTSGNGLIEIPCNDSANTFVYINHPEYQPEIAKISYHCGDTITLQVKPLHYQIDEIVVTGTRTERPMKEVAVHTRVVRTEDILKSGTTNVAEALTRIIPGFEFYNEGRGMTFRLQGIAAKYTLFLIDGERMAGENRDNIDYYRLNASSFQKAEIVNGASSSLYGSNAIAGVINLITPVPRKPFELNIQTRISKYGELEIGSNAGLKHKKLTSYTDFVWKSTNGYDLTPATSDLYTMEPHHMYNLYQKFIIEASPKLTLTLRGAYYLRERFDVSEVPVHPLYTDYNGGIEILVKPHNTTTVKLSSFSDLYKSYNILERRNNDKMLLYSNLQHTIRLMVNHTAGQGFFAEKHDITGASEFFYDNMYSERILDSSISITNYTLLIQDEITINRYFSAIAGCRYDYHSIYHGHFSPKISFMYKHKHLIHRFTYGHGFRAPSIKERFYDFDLGFIVIRGNSGLTPESSDYFSVSTEYNNRFFVPSINIYFNKVRDMIHEVPLADVENGYTYMNFSRVNITGTDLTFRLKPAEFLTLNGGYSYTHAIDMKSGNRLTGLSNHAAAAGCEITGTYKDYTAGLALNGKMYSRKIFTTLDESTYQFYDEVFPAYSLWNVAFNQEFMAGAIKLTLGLNNIFDYVNTHELILTDPGRRLYFVFSISPDKLYKQIQSYKSDNS